MCFWACYIGTLQPRTYQDFRPPKAQQANSQCRGWRNTSWPVIRVPRGCPGTTCKQALPKNSSFWQRESKWASDESIPEAEARVGAVLCGTREHQGYWRQERTEAGAGCRFPASSRRHREPSTGSISIAALNSKQKGHYGPGRRYPRAEDQSLCTARRP